MQLVAVESFEDFFKADSLLKAFEENFRLSRTRGIDRRTGSQFAAVAQDELEIASAKVLSGNYRFTPYAEVLRAKGRDKSPRLIGIPTIRDRVILYQVTRFLSMTYPAQVPRNLAKKTISSIVEELSSGGLNGQDVWVCSTDIKTFYDSIDRDRLICILEKNVKSVAALTLIRRALITPIVTRGSQRASYCSFKREFGVPQGLSISNILAAIYLMDVDLPMKSLGVKYWRYVDDVLMIGGKSSVIDSFESLRRRLKRRSLHLHSLGSSKTALSSIGSSFNYLGYKFIWPKITVKDDAVDRFLVGIAGLFSSFIQSKYDKLKTYAYLNEARLKEIFLLELNDRISGAISGHRRYGWVAYYNAINDLPLLKRMDFSISKMFARLAEFEGRPPIGLKKLNRAFYEMRHRPLSGYVRNYDLIVTVAQKIQFLERRGVIAPDVKLDDGEVDRLFSRYRRTYIDSVQSDEGSFYGA